MLYLLLIILFSLVYFDAKILREQDDPLYGNYFKSSPLSWAFCCGLLLVPCVPIYLFRRRNFKREMERQLAAELTPLDYFSDGLGMLISWVLWVTVIDVLVYLFSLFLPAFETKLSGILFSTVLEDALMIFLIYRVTRRYPSGGFLASVGISRTKGSFLKIVFFPALIGLSLAYVSSLQRMNDPNPPVTPMSELLESSSSLMFLLFCGSAVLLAPLVEEIIFRGYFYGILSRLKGKGFAIFCVSIMFALMHVWQYWGDWMAIMVVTILGFVLSWLRAVNGVTTSSIVTHYVYNGFLFVFPFIIFFQTHTAYFEYQFNYKKLDNPSKEALLEKSIKDQPSWYAAYNDLAWLYAEQGKNLRKALELVEHALAEDPENEAYLDTKAEVLFRLQRFAEAIEIEKALVYRNPDENDYQRQLEKFEEGFKKFKSQRLDLPIENPPLNPGPSLQESI